jgi:molecular chaperone HtpG
VADEQIPFEVEAGRVIELLARQIYQTPLALLRENSQNAFDAILMRLQRAPASFVPHVDVTLRPEAIVILDHGVGMSRDEVRNNFWRAGSSGKNTAEARAAGVVGTFGIGAMANFGIASELEVITESAATGERTRSFARKADLSTSKKCISIEDQPSTGQPGTSVVARCGAPVSVTEATNYLRGFVAHIPFAVDINGTRVSQQPYENDIPELEGTAEDRADVEVAAGLVADVRVVIGPQADVWVRLSRIRIDGKPASGAVIVRQGKSMISTYRSGFGLSPAAVTSAFGFGGVVDLPLLVPTAGREALSTASLQFLQVMVEGIDRIVVARMSDRPEANLSSGLMTWALQHGKVDLCGRLRLRRDPNGREFELQSLRRDRGYGRVRYFGGNDASILEAHASEDTPVFVLATRTPRRTVEQRYLQAFCDGEEISGQPQVIRLRKEETVAESAFRYRVSSILEGDYFVRIEVRLGDISHGLPVIVEGTGAQSKLVISPTAGCNSAVIALYDSDWAAFGSMVKDYVRSIVFPKIQSLVPSARRDGALAFLRSIQRPREVFEYERQDMQSLHEIWAEYAEGHVSFEEAANRSRQVARASTQVFDSGSARLAREVIGDVLANAAVMELAGQRENPGGIALPGIDRSDVATDAKLLVLEPAEIAIRGYRCFISVVDKVREERGDFFLQAHHTSVVWGGQRVLFVFQHFSGEYGLYYDLQSSRVVADQSGGGVFDTCTIVMKNRIYIPVPEAIQAAFIPSDAERKRFEVRCDVLMTGEA